MGITNDLTRRLAEHRKGKGQSGQWIGEFELLHTEVFTDYIAARLRECISNLVKVASGSTISLELVVDNRSSSSCLVSSLSYGT
ncbi:MAG: hypothetical protein HOH58_17445 [Opitutaceae bacterium]|nr:hypothetical protein [Opitutaceae bacterium]